MPEENSNSTQAADTQEFCGYSTEAEYWEEYDRLKSLKY